MLIHASLSLGLMSVALVYAVTPSRMLPWLVLHRPSTFQAEGLRGSKRTASWRSRQARLVGVEDRRGMEDQA